MLTAEHPLEFFVLSINEMVVPPIISRYRFEHFLPKPMGNRIVT